MKDKLILFFFLKLIKNQIFCQSNQKEFYLTLANLVDIFKALNVLTLYLQGKKITLY